MSKNPPFPPEPPDPLKASKTSLTGVELNEASEGKPASVTMELNGRPRDLAAMTGVASQTFPDAPIVKKDGYLYITVPLQPETAPEDDRGAAEYTGQNASDIVEKLFDASHCNLGFQILVGSIDINSGSKPPKPSEFIPEALVQLAHQDAAKTLVGRTVMDVVERKLHKSLATRGYNLEREDSGIMLGVSPGGETFTERYPDKDAAEHRATYIANQVRLALGVAPRDVTLVGLERQLMETKTTKGGTAGKPTESFSVVLRGNEEDLKRAEMAMGKRGGVTFDRHLLEAGKDDAELRINIPHEQSPAIAIGRVHTSTGCKLPFKVEFASSEISIQTPDGVPFQFYEPTMIINFNDLGKYGTDDFLGGLLQYTGGLLGEPFQPRVDDEENRIKLSKPVFICTKKRYESEEEAFAEAQKIARKVKPMIEYPTQVGHSRE